MIYNEDMIKIFVSSKEKKMIKIFVVINLKP
jgi:hypothetical protein